MEDMTAIREPMEGFKETEIGLIPIEWESSKLSAVATQRKETILPEGNGKTKYVGLEHIDSGEINLHRHGYDTEVRSGKFRFYTGDILYGKLRPYLDKCVLAEFEGICSTDIIVLKALDKANNQYLSNLMHISSFLEHAKKLLLE